MSDELTFVDTNILVYAHDADAGDKQKAAGGVLGRLWQEESGAISAQVLQEFYVTVTRKLPKPLAKPAAREVIRTYQAWPVYYPNVDDILAASELEERHGLSFWDALIVTSARMSGATGLLSEDFQDGRRIDGVMVSNPLN